MTKGPAAPTSCYRPPLVTERDPNFIQKHCREPDLARIIQQAQHAAPIHQGARSTVTVSMVAGQRASGHGWGRMHDRGNAGSPRTRH